MVREHYADLFDFALSILRQPASAEDILQDVLLNIWEGYAEWHPRVSERAYLFAAVRNRAHNALRDRRKFANSSSELRDLPEGSSSDEQVHYGELIRDFRRALAELPERTREVYRLSRLYGLTYEEIAAVQGVSINTVRSQISSALKHLRFRLAEHLHLLL